MEFKSFCFTPNSAFDDRNKEYGAYVLREGYDRRVVTAMIIVIIASALALGYPLIEKLILKLFNSYTKEEIVVEKIDKEVVLEDIAEELPKEEPPKIDIDVPPPPPVSTIQFVPPVIVDEPVKEEELTTNEEIKENVISTSTVVVDGSEGGDIGNLEAQKGGGSGETGVKVEVGNDEIYEVAQVTTDFPGGMEAFYKAVKRELKYPKQAERNGVKGKVTVQFVIEKDGSMTNIKVLRGIGAGCDEEASRVLSVIASQYKWIPAQQNGVAVRQRKSLPIIFNITD